MIEPYLTIFTDGAFKNCRHKKHLFHNFTRVVKTDYGNESNN